MLIKINIKTLTLKLTLNLKKKTRQHIEKFNIKLFTML